MSINSFLSVLVVLSFLTECVIGQGITEQQRQILELLDKKKPEFQKASNDSVFVTQNSDSPYRFIYLRRGDEPEDVEEEIFKGKPGEVVGPFRSGSHNYLFKILEHDSMRFKIRAKHIYIKTEGFDREDSLEAFATAQKLARSINKGQAFETAFKEAASLEAFKKIAPGLGFNTDAIASDGDLGWIWEGTTVPQIDQILTKAKKGEAVPVKTAHGAHVFLVQEKEQGYYKTKIISVVKKVK